MNNSPLQLVAGVLLLGLALPGLLGWLTYRVLQHRYPEYTARAAPALLAACVANWLLPPLLLSLAPSTFIMVLSGLAAPVAGAAFAYYRTRRPR